MLLRFSVANYLSFQQETEFSMLAGEGNEHPSHLFTTPKQSDFRCLASAVLYGANASGKSNLLKAIFFAKQLITQGVPPHEKIEVRSFKLDPQSAEKPSTFSFEFATEQGVYAYGFSAMPTEITEEWLYNIASSEPSVLFERVTQEGKASVTLGESLQASDEDRRFLLEYVTRGTRPNQLFLNECEDKNFSLFQDVFQWFKDYLVVIFPNTPFPLEVGLENTEFKEAFLQTLSSFNTGITDLAFEDMPAPEQVKESQATKDIFNFILSESKQDSILFSFSGMRVFIQRDQHNELKIRKILTEHQGVRFSFQEESDGTQRIFDLIPFLMSLKNKKGRVVLVDELERSLHPLAVRLFLNSYFRERSSTSQLIVTTHELTLLDLALFRRDEIWFVEKKKSGASSLHSLEEYNLDKVKELQLGYLQGRFGGIPPYSSDGSDTTRRVPATKHHD
jgi:AAA15 family ATPase/GTPase